MFAAVAWGAAANGYGALSKVPTSVPFTCNSNSSFSGWAVTSWTSSFATPECRFVGIALVVRPHQGLHEEHSVAAKAGETDKARIAIAATKNPLMVIGLSSGRGWLALPASYSFSAR